MENSKSRIAGKKYEVDHTSQFKEDYKVIFEEFISIAKTYVPDLNPEALHEEIDRYAQQHFGVKFESDGSFDEYEYKIFNGHTSESKSNLDANNKFKHFKIFN